MSRESIVRHGDGELGRRDPFVAVVTELVRAGWKQRRTRDPVEASGQNPQAFPKAAKAAGEAALYAEGLERAPGAYRSPS